MSGDRDLQTRVTQLEVALAHHQRDYDTLNLVVTEQADQLDRLRRTLQRLTERLESLQSAAEASPRQLEDDKPPHY